MREIYMENLSCVRPKQVLKQAPAVRKHKLNKKKFFITLTLFAVLVALGIVGIQSFTFKDDLKSNPSAASENNSAAGPANNETLLAGKVIVVDAGHGGFDPGATGISGERESDLNLKMASVLQASLKAAGASVVMTRTDKNAIAPTKDEDMAKRREITQESNADLFISVHMNMETDASFKGPILMFQQGSVLGENLAKAITNGINSNIKTLAPCKYRSADLIVLRDNREPSVLVECGFISNSEEEQKLLSDSYQKEFAQAVASGIESFIAKDTTVPSNASASTPPAKTTQKNTAGFAPTASPNATQNALESVKNSPKSADSIRNPKSDASGSSGSKATQDAKAPANIKNRGFDPADQNNSK